MRILVLVQRLTIAYVLCHKHVSSKVSSGEGIKKSPLEKARTIQVHFSAGLPLFSRSVSRENPAAGPRAHACHLSTEDRIENLK
jgi:hypothetical protein